MASMDSNRRFDAIYTKLSKLEFPTTTRRAARLIYHEVDEYSFAKLLKEVDWAFEQAVSFKLLMLYQGKYYKTGEYVTKHPGDEKAAKPKKSNERPAPQMPFNTVNINFSEYYDLWLDQLDQLDQLNEVPSDEDDDEDSTPSESSSIQLVACRSETAIGSSPARPNPFSLFERSSPLRFESSSDDMLHLPLSSNFSSTFLAPSFEQHRRGAAGAQNSYYPTLSERISKLLTPNQDDLASEILAMTSILDSSSSACITMPRIVDSSDITTDSDSSTGQGFSSELENLYNTNRISSTSTSDNGFDYLADSLSLTSSRPYLHFTDTSDLDSPAPDSSDTESEIIEKHETESVWDLDYHDILD